MRFFNRRRGIVLALTILVIACAPSYVRAFVIAGDSDAPAFVTRDRVLVNFAAYDIRIPFSRTRLVTLGDPSPGDVVLFRLPNGRLMIERVIGGPGTRITMRDNHLTINGIALKYAAVTQQEKAAITRGRLGEVVEIEGGGKRAACVHLIQPGLQYP